MKRPITALTALLLAVSMVGCGDTTEDKKSSRDKTTASITLEALGEDGEDSGEKTDSAEDKTDGGDSQSDDKTDGGEQQPVGLDSEDYKAVLYEYVEAGNSGDTDRLLHIMFPDKAIRCVTAMLESDEIDLNEVFEQQFSAIHIEITEIVEEEKLSADKLDMIMSAFDEMCVYTDILDKYGSDLDNLTDEQFYEMHEMLDSIEQGTSEHSVIINEGYEITLYVTNNGEPDKADFYVYYVEGEGWKADTSMPTYVKKSNLKSANMNAKTAFNAAVEYLYIDDRSQDEVMLDSDFGVMSRDGLYLSGSAPVEPGAKAVYDLLRYDCGINEGIVYIGVHDGDIFIHFYDEKNEVIGQYPNAISWDNFKSVTFKEYLQW